MNQIRSYQPQQLLINICQSTLYPMKETNLFIWPTRPAILLKFIEYNQEEINNNLYLISTFDVLSFSRMQTILYSKKKIQQKLQIKYSQEEISINLNMQALNKIQIMNIHLQDVRGVSVSRPQDVSIFHLIVWVFAVTFQLQDKQRRRIKAIYGDSNQIIDPVTPSIEAFLKVMESIKNKNQKCVVKIVVDQRLSKNILETSKKYDQIIQIFLFNPKGTIEASYVTKQLRTHSDIVKRGVGLASFQNYGDEENQINIVKSEIVPSSSKIVGIIRNFNYAIDKAQRQVEAFTKSFRTFENSKCLIGDFQQISRYRFRLIASIKLKISDYSQSLKSFKDFILKSFPWLNNHLRGMAQNGLSFQKLISSLFRYETAAKNFMEYQEKRSQQLRQKRQKERIDQKESQKISKSSNTNNFSLQQQQFFNQIVSIYQDEGFFYHIINSHLKLTGERNTSWKQLILPFSHLYRAIKYLYRQGLEIEPAFYKSQFTVYRGGRARLSQIRKYQEALNSGGAFVQFFGFLSTSLSAKIVADKFVASKNSRDNERNKEDQDVIFRIKINPNEEILKEKYDFLVNGFFKLAQKQVHGQFEKQVLFNAMNVFRLLKIGKIKIRDLFNQTEKEEVRKKEEQIKKFSQFKYREEKMRTQYYNRQVTVVDLQFGSFYECLLTENKYDLSEAERAAKENFVYCMNKVDRYDKFDYGDACQLTNELPETYHYLKSKVGGSEEEMYLSSKVDNKNYFSRLSAVCQKLGKAKEALGYSRIAIECYKQLQSVHLNEVYNSHYEKLFEMQKKSIEILRESANYISACKQLREQLEMIRSKKFKEPKVKLRQSQIYINQAINYYSMGKLEECINRFQKCEHQLKKTITAFSFEEEPLSCYFPAFFAQLFCPNPQIGRTCSYSLFGSQLKRLKMKIRERELVQKYGKKEELEKNSSLANNLLGIVNQAVTERKKLFKSRKKYVEFITKFNNQFSLSSHNQKQFSIQEQKIKETIQRLSNLQQESKQYSQVLIYLNQLIQKFSQKEKNNLLIQHRQVSIWDFIKKFKEKERKRKIKRLQDIKESILTENKHQLIERYLLCANEIQQAISDLKEEGYVDSSINILKMRVQKSKIYQYCNDRQAALNQIKQIIQFGIVQGEDRYKELAHAYSIKGKIHLQMNEIQLALNCFKQALECFPKSVIIQQDNQSLDVSAVTNNELELSYNNYNQLDHNNDYLQTRIFKMKALLIWIQFKKRRQNGISSSIFEQYPIDFPWQKKHSDEHLREVQAEIIQMRAILKSRSVLEDVQDLRCELLEVETYFFLNSLQTEKNLSFTLQSLGQNLCLRSRLQGNDNQKNGLICCQIISRHSENKNFLNKFVQIGYRKWLSCAQANLNCTYNWKIQKAQYFLERAGGRQAIAREYLKRAIQLLKFDISNKHDFLLEDELNNLKWKLAERPSNQIQVNRNSNEMDALVLPMQSTLIQKSKILHRSNYNRYQSKRQSLNSTQISNISNNITLKTQQVNIKPSNNQNPESPKTYLQMSSLALRQFCRKIGRSRRPQRTFL